MSTVSSSVVYLLTDLARACIRSSGSSACRSMPNRAQLLFVFSFISTFGLLFFASRFLISYLQLFQTSEGDSSPNVFAMAWAYGDLSAIQQNQVLAFVVGILGTSIYLFYFGSSSESSSDWAPFRLRSLYLESENPFLTPPYGKSFHW